MKIEITVIQQLPLKKQLGSVYFSAKMLTATAWLELFR